MKEPQKLRTVIALLVFQSVFCVLTHIVVIVDSHFNLIVNTVVHPYSRVSFAFVNFDSAKRMNPMYMSGSDLLGILWNEWELLIRCIVLASLATMIVVMTAYSLNAAWKNIITTNNIHSHLGGSVTSFMQSVSRKCGMYAIVVFMGIASLLALPGSLAWGRKYQVVSAANHFRPLVIEMLNDWPPTSTWKNYNNYGKMISYYRDTKKVWGLRDVDYGTVLSLPEIGLIFRRDAAQRRVGVYVFTYRGDYMVMSLDDESARYGDPLVTLSGDQGDKVYVYVFDCGDVGEAWESWQEDIIN